MSPPHASIPGAPSRRDRHAPPPPAVDERLVMPETRYEAIDGKISYVCPSDEPHGTYHSKIAALLEAYVASTHRVAVDMLTRTSEKNDMAPDASVFPAERDAETGGRKLEELAFEVVSTETIAHAGRKALALTKRGVRRVFAVDVERRRVLEWSRRTGTWEILPRDGAIEDATLALPLPLPALAEATRADDAVAHALLAKKNPIIEEALQAAATQGERKGKLEGEVEGARKAIIQILDARGLRVGKKVEERVRAEQDEATLARWLSRAVSCKTAGEILDP